MSRPSRPEPPPPAPPTIRSVRPTLRCGTAIPHATLVVDNPDDDPGLRDPLTGQWIAESGFAIFDLPQAWPNGPFGVNLTVIAEGYQDFEMRFTLADFNEIPPDSHNPNLRIQMADGADPYPRLDYTLTPEITLLPLHPDGGEGFTDAAGTPWTQIGCSDFRLFQRYLAGEDITPILAERIAIGFNQLRVFLMCNNMFRLIPAEYPDYQDRLAAFCQMVAQTGLRLELTVFVDAHGTSAHQGVMPSLSEQQAFYGAVCATVKDRPYVFLELVNEIDQEINIIDASQFSKPSGVISSHGSKGIVDAAVEAVCVEPLWDYGTLHPKREPDWPRYGHNIHEDIWLKFRKPGTINESCRPNQGNGPVTSDFFDAAVNMGVMGCGGTFHSEAGKDSRLFSPDEHACAVAWVRGATNVDLTLRNGQYVAGHLSLPKFPVTWREGDSVRAHGRIAGNKAMCSLPQMKPDYKPEGQDGWRIVYQDGSYIECER